jgi:hypothetical protein
MPEFMTTAWKSRRAHPMVLRAIWGGIPKASPDLPLRDELLAALWACFFAAHL